MKPRFSDPKMYTGGVDISRWSRLSKKDQQAALKSDWYVYYAFQHPETGRLVRQPNIKARVNRYKTKRERLSFLKTKRNSLALLLESGLIPMKILANERRHFLKSTWYKL